MNKTEKYHTARNRKIINENVYSRFLKAVQIRVIYIYYCIVYESLYSVGIILYSISNKQGTLFQPFHTTLLGNYVYRI